MAPQAVERRGIWKSFQEQTKKGSGFVFEEPRNTLIRETEAEFGISKDGD